MKNKEDLIVLVNIVLEGKGKQSLSTINDNTHLRNDIGFDSFDLAELTVRIEDKFGVDVFSKGIVSTFGELLNLVNDGD